MWIQPIYDRAQSDVDNKTSKGYLNYTDMNRIEGNIAYIAEIMGVSVETKAWTALTVPSSKDFDRINNNINTLKKVNDFTSYKDLPGNPINTYDKVNLIESLLYAIEYDYELILGNNIYTGDSCYTGDTLI